MTNLWQELIGQQRAVEVLQRAVAGDAHAMTHAWLFVGPPGSGRSNAAKAFAAALQCSRAGCGECNECRTALSGAHPDVTLLRTEQLSIGVSEVRDLVSRANVAPLRGRYQIVVVEDADRVTERGADALLKALEEPSPKTVWLLCAPSADDVIVTVRSRCRELRLVTPHPAAVAQLLVDRDGIAPELAAQCARIAQGHVGRARALARIEEVRERRRQVLAVPTKLATLTNCLVTAEALVANAHEEANRLTEEQDAKELTDLRAALGASGKAKPRHAQAAIRELEDQQKARAKRLERDSLDHVLTELTGYYRDILACHSGRELINADLEDELSAAAQRLSGEQTVHCLDAILQARTALESNVAPVLAMEAMLIQLGRVSRAAS